MKKIRMAFFALATLALLATSTACGGGGGGGSDDDDATPVAESGSTGGSESDSSESGTGNTSTGSGNGSTSTSIPAGFVAVPGATFTGETAITGSRVFIAGRTVTIPSLLVCDHEVTQAEYKSVMKINPSCFSWAPANGETQANRPVEQVSWYDALVYCNKRSIAEGRTPCYKIGGKDNPSEWGSVPEDPEDSNSTWNTATCDFAAGGYRLPTEAEWEYLARGGNLTNSGQTTYSGSNTIGDVAWYKVNANDVGTSSPNYGTHQVKTKNPNGKTLYDMSGNVCEWCWDWNGSISTSTLSSGAASGSSRVLRGGGWNDGASLCTVSYRYGYNPNIRYDYIGFRVVCSRSE